MELFWLTNLDFFENPASFLSYFWFHLNYIYVIFAFLSSSGIHSKVQLEIVSTKISRLRNFWQGQQRLTAVFPKEDFENRGKQHWSCPTKSASAVNLSLRLSPVQSRSLTHTNAEHQRSQWDHFMCLVQLQDSNTSAQTQIRAHPCT